MTDRNILTLPSRRVLNGDVNPPEPAAHPGSAGVKIRFGLFEADLEAGELRKSGVPVRIQAQPFRVLAFLLERPGQVVARDDIQRHLWGADAMVDLEHSLGTAIHKIRECLDDKAANPRFIETVARSGYRFIAPVTVVSAPAHGATVKKSAAAQEPGSLPSSAAEPGAAPLQTGSAGSASIPLRWRPGAMLAGVGLVCAGAGYWLASRAAYPYRIPPHITRITFSGRVSPGDSLFHNYAGMAADGLRIYLPQIEGGRTVLAEALIASGETSTLPLSAELTEPFVDDVSPDGSRLLLRNNVDTEPEQALWLASTIGGTAHQIPGILGHAAAFLHDGQQIVYAAGDDLYIARDNGAERRKLVSLPGRASWLRWSPDMSRLRMTVVNNKTHTSRLWEVSADGTGAHELLHKWSNGSSECCGSWTADGHYYVFQSMTSEGSNIWAIPEHNGWWRASAKPIAITNGPLSYQSPIAVGSGHRIFFVGLDTKSELLQLERATASFVAYPGGIQNALRVEFSRDGKWVAWISQNDGSLWHSRSDGSGRGQLTTPQMQVERMAWSPGGRRLVLMARQPGESWKLYTADVESGHLEPLLNEQYPESDPDWSPDGKTVAFARPSDSASASAAPEAIYTIDLATRRVTKLPDSEGLLRPRWSPSGNAIAALSADQSQLMLFDPGAKTWRRLAMANTDDFVWSQDGKAIYFQDLSQRNQPICKLLVAGGKVERVADLHDVRLANVIDYRLAGLAPGDVPLVSARTSAADLYSAEVPH